MSYPPWIAFIDLNGNPAAKRIAEPRDTLPGQPIVDSNGRAVAMRVHVPRKRDFGEAATALAQGVAVTPHSWYPGFIAETLVGGSADDVWIDDWSCNEHSENFDAPPLAEPPWDVVAATYNNGEVRGEAYLRKLPIWPAVFRMDFHWFDTVSGTPKGYFEHLTVLRTSGWQANSAILIVTASATPWNPPAYEFSFRLGSDHVDFGAHSSGLYSYPNTDPWLLDGTPFTATIYDAGRIECSFYGVNWNNGGPT